MSERIGRGKRRPMASWSQSKKMLTTTVWLLSYRQTTIKNRAAFSDRPAFECVGLSTDDRPHQVLRRVLRFVSCCWSAPVKSKGVAGTCGNGWVEEKAPNASEPGGIGLLDAARWVVGPTLRSPWSEWAHPEPGRVSRRALRGRAFHAYRGSGRSRGGAMGWNKLGYRAAGSQRDRRRCGCHG